MNPTATMTTSSTTAFNYLLSPSLWNSPYTSWTPEPKEQTAQAWDYGYWKTLGTWTPQFLYPLFVTASQEKK